MVPPSDLERRLRELDPRVRLIPVRQLFRVRGVLADRGDRPATSLELPLLADAAALETAAVPTDLGGEFLLLAVPDDRLITSFGEKVFERYRRSIERFSTAASLNPSAAAKGLSSLPGHVARELRFVLESDHLLPYDAPPEATAVAAAIAVAELGDRAADVFPSAPPAGQLLKALDPGLAPFPQNSFAPGPCDDIPVSPPDAAAEPSAVAAARRGNAARAAVRFSRAGQAADAEATLRSGLVAPLAEVFGWDAAKAAAWFGAVLKLPASAGSTDWSPAAKCLYDLQALAADFRRPVFAVAPIDWALSLGKKPLRRPLAPVRDVLLARRFQKAADHAARSALPAGDRTNLVELLAAETRAVAGRARVALGPVIVAALDAAGLIPRHPAEVAARDRVVAELLDHLCDRGHLRFADVRDAVARNNLKLPDLSSVGEWLSGDALLRLDKHLRESLFGVYHGAEVYLRAIQRFSAVGFGTPLGRAISLYAALPFGGAFLFLEAVQHLFHAAAHLGHVFQKAVVPPEPEIDYEDFAEAAVEIATAPPPPPVGFVHWYTLLPLGLFILVLIHSPPFRAAVIFWLGEVGRGLKTILVDGPAGVIAALRRSRPVQVVLRYTLWPAVVGAAAAAALAVAGAPLYRVVLWPFAAALLAAALGNSRSGWAAREWLAETLADLWRQVRGSVVPGLIAFFQNLFRELLAAVDRLLYSVDEALRFREGASEPSVALKAVAAASWFPVAYAVRFAFYLLFEPQVNPVKHFPVVTVSHKLLLPLIPSVASGLKISEWWAGLGVGLVPGVFGFLVWELKENWRLYAANRPKKLPAAVVGHHGETVRGLLRPGFHSGTVPKLFRKLRSGWLTGEPAPHADAARHDLHHLAGAVRRLAEREILPLWERAGIGGVTVAVTFGCQSMAVAFGRSGAELKLLVENRPAGLCGAVAEIGWAKELPGDQKGFVDAGVEAFLTLAAAGGGTEWAQWKTYWK